MAANRGAELERAIATILFVDIVRSTEKAARLGASRWTQVMNHYYAAVRRELKALRGKEVVTTGDGLLATFDAPAAGDPLCNRNPRGSAHAGPGDQGGATRRRIQSERG
jgi:class 3 adenylate cyclase